jgi:2-octaprenylphenol hydroxylase
VIAEYDGIVVGAGMVGATAALALAAGGLRVALVDKGLPAELGPADAPDLRVSAISPAGQRILRALGVWHRLPGQRVTPYRRMEVWDSDGDGAIAFDAGDIGVPWLGHIVENRVVQLSLLEGVKAEPRVDLLAPATPRSFRDVPGGLELILEEGRVLRAALLVGADGGSSRIRSLAGIATRGWRYDQRALVATVSTEQDHRHTAWQRFLPAGPVAFLPLWGGRSSIVWSTLADRAEALLGLDEAGFAAELTKAIDGRLGAVTDVGPRATIPLALRLAGAYIRPRLALVGDAAHTIHPLAGQGVNLGLLDAACLAELVIEARAGGRDWGGWATLRRYERWRKGHNLALAAAMDGFKRLFGSRWAPVRLLRGIGLNLTDRAAPVKHWFMRQAMGDVGDLPALARPHSDGWWAQAGSAEHEAR